TTYIITVPLDRYPCRLTYIITVPLDRYPCRLPTSSLYHWTGTPVDYLHHHCTTGQVPCKLT
ncbi:hypothetical protein LEMLEM_LOCUS16736, partial [Lemmus lemmus]